MTKMFLGKGKGGGLRSRLVRAATGTFALKVGAKGLTFVIAVALARLLGVTSYGVYSYAMAWASLLGVLATFGLDQLLTRNIAAYQAQSAWGLIKGLMRWANRMVLILSLGLALLMVGGIWLMSPPQMSSALYVAVLILPLIALVSLKRATLHGLYHVVGGGLLEMLIRPLSFILIIGCVYFVLREGLSTDWAVGLNVMAMGVAFLMGTQLVQRALPAPVNEATPVYQARVWTQSALPLMFVGVLQAIDNHTAILMLGTITGTESVAIYNVAKRGAELIAFILTAVNTSLAPIIASLYAANEMERLQRVITKSARMVLFVSLPIALSLIAFGDWFLLLFGSAFTQGHIILVILSVGHLVDAAAGSVGLLLIMTRHELDAAVSVGIRALLTVILTLSLIPRWGAIGAAIATASSLIVWNLVLAIWVYQRTGIHSTALGRIRLRSEI